jgi:hypothetical protein
MAKRKEVQPRDGVERAFGDAMRKGSFCFMSFLDYLGSRDKLRQSGHRGLLTHPQDLRHLRRFRSPESH